ncbi:MAG: branched-chain amino acid ABC transporter permease, partial [Pseudomonadota bacterium]
MSEFARRHPIWSAIIAIVVLILLYLIFAIWPEWLVNAIGRKKIFLNALFNGITLGGLYFLVASGFTLIFGLMRNVNMAHGSLYLFGGYIGFYVSNWTGLWLLAFPVAFLIVGLTGIL